MGTTSPQVLLRPQLFLDILGNTTMSHFEAYQKMSETKKQPHQMKTTRWCITYWLTEGRSLDSLNELVANMPQNWSLEGQIEQGHDKDDKLHAQLFLKTEQTRGTKIQKYFPDCYIDEAQNPFALKNYVHKKDTRVAEFKTVENRSPQWRLVVEKFADWLVLSRAHNQHDDQQRLELWDSFILESIKEGMNIDIIGVNPQYRSCIVRYWDAYVYKALHRQIDRQTSPVTFVEPLATPPSAFI